MSEPRVRTQAALVAILANLTRDVRDLVRNPVAFFGGLGGTVLTFGLLLLSLTVLEGDANAEDDEDAFMIEFEPGTLVKLGQKAPEQEIPEKVVRQETRVEQDSSAEAVTEDETLDPKDEDKEKDKPEKNPQKRPPKDSKLPTNKLPSEKNTDFDDSPTDARETDPNSRLPPSITEVGDDPFGDPDGWSDMKRSGDPWATNVMKQLNNARLLGAAYAKGTKGTFEFYLTICKDGSVQKVLGKGGNLASDLQGRISSNISGLKFPAPPGDIIRKMPSRCARIKHKFRFVATGDRWIVK